MKKFFQEVQKRKMDLNFDARKQGWFSCNELKKLSKKEDCN